MQIKRTRILHKRYTLAEWEHHDLKQGEIGSLIDDAGSIIETRIGTHDVQLDNGQYVGQKFQNALLLSSVDTVTHAVRQFTSYDDFPSKIDNTGNRVPDGNIYTLYIDMSTNAVYRWDESLSQYVGISSSGGGVGSWTVINGGGALL